MRKASHCGSIEITRRAHSISACSCHIYMGVVLHAHFVCGESHIQHNDNSSDSLTRVNDSSRVTNFDDSDSTRVTLRKIVTRIDSSHVFYKMTRLESQSMARDSSQSHFCKISEPLIDKPSLFAYQEIIIFLVQE